MAQIAANILPTVREKGILQDLIAHRAQEHRRLRNLGGTPEKRQLTLLR